MLRQRGEGQADVVIRCRYQKCPSTPLPRSKNGTQRSRSLDKIARVNLLPDAPSIGANEIAGKGYINQCAALERGAAEIWRLFAASPEPGAIAVL